MTPKRPASPWPVVAAAVLVAATLLGVRAAPLPEARSAPLELALTVDDLTRANVQPEPERGAESLDRMVAAFARHRLPPVTGFLNGATLERHPEDRPALERWVAAGHRLGNHSFSHVDLGRVGSRAFLADVERNEPLLRDLAGPAAPERDWRVFRFPYLQEGATIQAHDEVRARLLAKGYRIAPVTVDFDDWQWFPSHARCARDGDSVGTQRLRARYRAAAREALLAADAKARRLFGRPIPQILLLHAGEFSALLMDELIAEYAAMGVRFVSLDEALADPVYALDPRVARSFGSPFLEQVAFAQRGETESTPWPPHAELAALCR